MLRSCVSLFKLAGAAAATDVAPFTAPGPALPAVAPVIFESGFPPSAAVGAGTEIPGLFACGCATGGLGLKYFAHTRITAMDSSDAARMRNSGVNLSFSCMVTNVPLCGYRSVLPATLPEPGRIQNAAK